MRLGADRASRLRRTGVPFVWKIRSLRSWLNATSVRQGLEKGDLCTARAEKRTQK